MQPINEPQCFDCKFFHNDLSLSHDPMNGFSCDAFPAGIPDEIINGSHDHKKPFPNDQGIRFEKADEVSIK